MLHVNIPEIGGSNVRLSFFYNEKEIGRIQANSVPPHQLSWPIELFQEREVEQRRPWYCEEIELKFFDENSSTSISNQLKSTYSRMKSAVNKQRGTGTENGTTETSDHNHIATIRVPLRDAHWSREAQDSIPRKSKNMEANRSGQGNPHGGRWYKILTSSHDEGNSKQRSLGEYLFVLTSLTIHGHEHEEDASARDSIVSIDAISRLTPPAPNFSLGDILPPSSPYFRHIYMCFDSAGEQDDAEGADMLYSTHCHIPLVAPTQGEEVLDMRENVQWRVSAGSNSFGDITYVLCKGLLILTDIRILFIPLFVTSSLWQHGAVLVPLQELGQYAFASGTARRRDRKSGQAKGRANEALLSTIKRYTFVLPLPALLECRYSSTRATTSSLRGGDDMYGDYSSGPAGSPEGEDTTSSSQRDKVALATARQFLSKAEKEYDDYVFSAHTEVESTGSSPRSVGAIDNRGIDIDSAGNAVRINRLRSLSSSEDPREGSEAEKDTNTVSKRYNIVFVCKDGTHTEFTILPVEAGLEVMLTSGGRIMEELEGSDDSDDSDSGSDSYSDTTSDNQAPLQSKEAFASRRALVIRRSARRLYRGGLASQFVRPGIWCARIRDLSMWLSCLDMAWARFALQLRATVEHHITEMESRALNKDTHGDDGDPSSNSSSDNESGSNLNDDDDDSIDDDDDGDDGDDGDDDDDDDDVDDDDEDDNAEKGSGGRLNSRLDSGRRSPRTYAYEASLGELRKCLSPLSMDQDLQRMRVQDAGWRLSDLNNSYALCASYPHILCFPESLTDDDVEAAAAQRSKNRLPAVVWLHPFNKSALVRSAQPFTGVSGNTKNTEHDVKLCLAIKNLSLVGFTPANEDDHDDSYTRGNSNMLRKPPLRIADARPKLNANANALQGRGYESITQFGGSANASLLFMDIENIHVMRNSITRLREGIAHSSWGFSAVIGGSASSTNTNDVTGYSTDGKMDTEVMYQSNWKTHLSLLLKGAVSIAESMMLGHSVLVHCSDGWDRTSQLTSLAQILLDPYYRSIEGFLMLLEKEWCAFGHRMESRLMMKSKRPFGGSKNPSKDDQSPVFLQYLDCVWQLTRQYPAMFEFSPNFLVVMSQAAQSGLFLSFRENNERERGALWRKTVDKLNIPREHLFYSSFAVYARLLFYSSSTRSQLVNPLYQRPSPRFRKLQYIRPRCSGPHDLELWREGLCGFLDSSLGVLHDPCSELMGLDQWQVHLLRRTESNAKRVASRTVLARLSPGQMQEDSQDDRGVHTWIRDHVVEELVEGAVEMCIRYLCLEQRAQRHMKDAGMAPAPIPSPVLSQTPVGPPSQPIATVKPPPAPPMQRAPQTPIRKGTPIGGPNTGTRRRRLSRSKSAKAKEKAKSAFASLKRLGGF